MEWWKNKVKSRRAIKSRLINVNVAEEKLKGNEAYVAGRMDSNCNHLKP